MGFPYDLTGQARCIASGRELRARWSSVIYVAKVSCRDADFPDPGQDQESGVADHRRQTAAGGLGVLALRRDLPGCGAEAGEGGGGRDEAARAASSGRERRTRSRGGLRSRSGRDDGLDVGETFGGAEPGAWSVAGPGTGGQSALALAAAAGHRGAAWRRVRSCPAVGLAPVEKPANFPRQRPAGEGAPSDQDADRVELVLGEVAPAVAAGAAGPWGRAAFQERRRSPSAPHGSQAAGLSGGGPTCRAQAARPIDNLTHRVQVCRVTNPQAAGRTKPFHESKNFSRRHSPFRGLGIAALRAAP